MYAEVQCAYVQWGTVWVVCGSVSGKCVCVWGVYRIPANIKTCKSSVVL